MKSLYMFVTIRIDTLTASKVHAKNMTLPCKNAGIGFANYNLIT